MEKLVMQLLVNIFLEAIPTFAVISKIDKLSEDDKKNHLPKMKADLLEELGIGEMEEKLFATSLYCSKITPKMKRSEQIDESMCELWQSMLAPEFALQRKKGFFSFGR